MVIKCLKFYYARKKKETMNTSKILNKKAMCRIIMGVDVIVVSIHQYVRQTPGIT